MKGGLIMKKNRTLPRGTAQIVTASTGPTLPLLMVNEGDDYPTYTGPLGVARLLVRRDRYLSEQFRDLKWWAFLSIEPDHDVREWGISLTSPEDALRRALGVYFGSEYDNDSLRAALRGVLAAELSELEQP